MFSEKTFSFLFENRLQNDKAWFTEHRTEYEEYVLNPMTELAKVLGPTVSAIDADIVTTPRVNKVLSRIYRDVRFSNDKSLYRDQIWLSFKRDKHMYVQYPEFFFVASRKSFCYGCGYYAPTPAATDSIRSLILEGDPLFRKAKKVCEQNDAFVLDGDLYKRSRYPDQPKELRQWLDRKAPSVVVKSDDLSLLYKPDLADRIGQDFQKLKPVYHFFLHAEEVKGTADFCK